MKKSALIITIIFLFINSNFLCQANDYYVTTAADAGAGSLRQAIINANGNPGADNIYFNISGTITLSSTMTPITDDLTVNGPGAEVLTIAGSESYTTMIVGSGDVDISGLRFFEGFAEVNGGGVCVLSAGAILIEDCVFEWCFADKDGGGVYLENGSLTVRNCDFFYCYTFEGGGGICIGDGLAAASYCEFNPCASDKNGGGISLENGTLNINSCSFIDCEAPIGGGICAIDGTLNADDCNIQYGFAIQGAGIYCEEGSHTINSTTVERSIAWITGGGVHIEDAEAYFNDCVIRDNMSEVGGGVLINARSVVEFARCDIYVNYADFAGGGVLIAEDAMALFDACAVTSNESYEGAGVFLLDDVFVVMGNTTIGDNWSVYDGGGIYMGADAPPSIGELYLLNCTIAENYANAYDDDPSSFGGGIYHEYGAIDIINTIIGDNMAGYDSPVKSDYCNSTTSSCPLIDRGYNIVESQKNSNTFTDPSTMLDIDPGLGTPDYHGGSTYCVSLKPSSPAIDAATDLSPHAPILLIPEEDQRGMSRIGAGAAYDIGAFEYQSGDADGDGVASEIENDGPNKGDADGDGTWDYLQDFVATFPDEYGNYLTIYTGYNSASYHIENCYNTDLGGVESLMYPLGITGFRLTGPSGFTSKVRIIFFRDYQADDITGFRWFGRRDPGDEVRSWYDAPADDGFYGVIGSGNTIIGGRAAYYVDLRLTDNRFGDENPLAGIIDDPFAPFHYIASIPALGDWHKPLLIGGLLFVGYALYKNRKKFKKN